MEFFKAAYGVAVILLALVVGAAVAGGRSNGKKRILIHVPLQVKQHHHTHTVYKHIVHEHDHEHQHHGESPPSGGDDVGHSNEDEDSSGGEYSASGSNADYKVLGYTYGDDAEPVLRLSDVTGGSTDSDEDADGRTLRGFDEWAPSKPTTRARRPVQQQKGSSSQRYRDHHRYRGNGPSDDDVVVLRSQSGRGNKGYSSNSNSGHTRSRPPSSNSQKGYHHPTAVKSVGGRQNNHHHYHNQQEHRQHEYGGDYDSGSHEDESSDEIWNEDSK